VNIFHTSGKKAWMGIGETNKLDLIKKWREKIGKTVVAPRLDLHIHFSDFPFFFPPKAYQAWSFPPHELAMRPIWHAEPRKWNDPLSVAGCHVPLLPMENVPKYKKNPPFPYY
jgi:hypothetical protein